MGPQLVSSQCGNRSFSAYVTITAKHVSDFEDGMPLEDFAGQKG